MHIFKCHLFICIIYIEINTSWFYNTDLIILPFQMICKWNNKTSKELNESNLVCIEWGFFENSKAAHEHVLPNNYQSKA